MTSLCSGRFVRIGGLDQWIAARGQCATNPGLFVIGGPGVALSRLAPLFAPWEQRFTLVHWDQPGAGATVARDPTNGGRALGLVRLEADAAQAIAAAREVFGIARIAVLGYSGGSIVGLRLAQRHPDLMCAYIGVGQFVNWRRQDALGYEIVLRDARSRGDAAAVADLERIGPPPYATASQDAVKSRYATALTPTEQAAFAAIDATTTRALRTPPGDACYLPANSTPQDTRALAFAAYEALRPELQSFAASSLGTAYNVAMFFFQGQSDTYAVTGEVESYAASIQAPSVQYAAIEGGGHSALFLTRPLGDLLEQRVRPLFP